MSETTLTLSVPTSNVENQNFYQRFAATVERFSSRVAVEMQGRDTLESVTYGELRRRAEIASAFLALRGIAAGDVCAILADNDIAWCAAYLGILRLAGRAVPLDTHYTAGQITTLLQDSGAKVLFTTPRYFGTAQEAIGLGSFSARIILLHGSSPGIDSLDEDLAQPCRPLPPCSATRLDPAVILYTSGTTSDPKGVVLTHGNLLAEAEAVFQVLRIDEHDSVLGVLPLFHALAQLANLLLPFLVGARVIYLEELSTAELLRALCERHPTAFCCVPKFFYLIHERVFGEAAKAGPLGSLAFRASLRACGAVRRFTGINLGGLLFRRVHRLFGRGMRLMITGGASFDSKIGRDLYSLGFSLLEAYGLTETSGAATLTRPGEGGLGTVGRPLAGIEVKIYPAEETQQGDSRDGEIAIRGPIVMQGYFNRPAATAAAMRDGWFLTGDLGYLDKHGRLTITGRKKEIIALSSGKKIYPEEVETHYAHSPYIKELCILGLPKPGGIAVEALHAVIVPNLDVMRARKIINMRELLRFEIENLSVHLSSYKRILSFEIWMESLPRTTTNKLKRYEIQSRALLRREETGKESPVAAPLTAEEAAWAADPIVARALELVRQSTRRKEEVRPDANLELDLGLDSIERVELLTNLELLFGTRCPEEAAQSLYTVRQLIEALRSQKDQVAAAQTSGDTWQRLLTDLPQDDPLFAELLKPHSVFVAAIFGGLKVGRALAWLFLGFRVKGLENIPKQSPFLLCPNHQSYLDPFLLVSALPLRTIRDLFFVGASEYFATPLRQRVARLLHVAPVDPDTRLVRAMQAGAFGLKHGKVLVLFPEGERSIDGEVKAFRKGAAILSALLQTPIVPAAFDGVFDVWPRNRAFRWSALLPWKRTKITLHLGPILAPQAPPSGSSGAQMEAQYAVSAQKLREVVVGMQDDLRRERTKSHLE